ncbi:glutaredoxin domain-containing protein [Aestuariimicrobium ganziense]|uniref:glutaredoxin domain-containing protein n=1 Tax=Aestuariimicrobium ganziense TaxID=2773677 RepID=UPI002E2B376F|nr:glutaredoxin domain-containing protein [Aestuariimicrobium ganziense]
MTVSRSSQADALAAIDQGGVVVYHRPGCGYCARLIRSVGRLAERATWVDIWADEDAAAYVRSVNDGNETVPTVVIDGVAFTNPKPSVVKAALER